MDKRKNIRQKHISAKYVTNQDITCTTVLENAKVLLQGEVLEVLEEIAMNRPSIIAAIVRAINPLLIEEEELVDLEEGHRPRHRHDEVEEGEVI